MGIENGSILEQTEYDSSIIGVALLLEETNHHRTIPTALDYPLGFGLSYGTHCGRVACSFAVHIYCNRESNLKSP